LHRYRILAKGLFLLAHHTLKAFKQKFSTLANCLKIRNCIMAKNIWNMYVNIFIRLKNQYLHINTRKKVC